VVSVVAGTGVAKLNQSATGPFMPFGDGEIGESDLTTSVKRRPTALCSRLRPSSQNARAKVLAFMVVPTGMSGTVPA
jgi:hypothetical protein